MKYKLAYKLFLALLLTNLIGIALLAVGMQYFMQRYFFHSVERVERRSIDQWLPLLAAEYQRAGDWNHLRDNQLSLRQLLKPFHARRKPPHHKGDKHHRPPPWFKPPHRPGHPPRHRDHPPPPPIFHFPPELIGEMINRAEQPSRADKPHRRLPRDPMMIIPRLTLFDAQKKWVVGKKIDGSQLVLYPIKINPAEHHEQVPHSKKTIIVGWLGIQALSTFFKPNHIEFIRQQTNGIYVSSIGVFLLSLIVAWWLSRHFVKPLQQLTTGTEALAARRFATRVTIKSRDEFGQLANDFNQMAQTLEQYEQHRQQWLADIAHELRTPLAILRGEIEALQDGIREINAETLDSLHAEVLLLTRLVEDLRTLSLADSHALILRQQPLNPIDVLQQTLYQFETRFAQTDIQIKTYFPLKENFSLQGDSDRLQQVFTNLFENVLRYVEAPGRLTINTTLTTTDLQIDFIDSGPGVPHFALPHLFERLYRVDRSRNRGKGGSGLGLAICKSIIEAHNGTITADHAPKGGLWIKIQLPIS